MGTAGDMDFTHVCKVYDHDFLRERERERERGGGGGGTRQDKFFISEGSE